MQDFFGEAAKDEFVSKLIWGIDLSLGLVCNLLFIIAIVYALAVMYLVVLPTSILKVCCKAAALRALSQRPPFSTFLSEHQRAH